MDNYTKSTKVLKVIINYGLCYSGESMVLEGYLDGSWITNKGDSSPTSGWVLIYWGGVISWSSKKQTCIKNSTMTLEFITLASTKMEAEGFRILCLRYHYYLSRFHRWQFIAIAIQLW